MNELMLSGRQIRVDEDGYICLNDMHKASGGDPSNKPAFFLRNDKTVKYLAAVRNKLKLQKCNFNDPVKKTKGRYGGTWVHELAAYRYASWLSPEFEASAYIALKESYTRSDLIGQQMMQQELQEFAYNEGRSKEKGTIGSKLMLVRKKEKHVLEKQAIILLKKYQYQLELKLKSV